METKAIILKKQNTNEYDQLVTCYTQEFGRMTAIAKSILKNSSIQAMHLDLFNLVEFDLVNGNGFPIITGAQAEHTYPEMKSSIRSISAVFVIGEYIDKLAPDYYKDDILWDFIGRTLQQLNFTTVNPRDILIKSQKELLQILGYHYPDSGRQPTFASLNTVFEEAANRQFKAVNFFYLVNPVLK